MRPDPRDRQRVAGDLRAALVGDVIGIDTFELRIGDAFATRSRRRLRALVADLPVPFWRRAFDAVRETLFPDGSDVRWVHPPPDIEIGDTLVIGREPGVSLAIDDDPSVSRRHVMLRRNANGWTAVDLQSTNGTYVNGWRIRRAHLKPSDELQVGDTVLRIAG